MEHIDNPNTQETTEQPVQSQSEKFTFEHIYNGMVAIQEEHHQIYLPVVEFKIVHVSPNSPGSLLNEKPIPVFRTTSFHCQWFLVDSHAEKLTPLIFDVDTYKQSKMRFVKINDVFREIKSVSNDPKGLMDLENVVKVAKWIIDELISEVECPIDYLLLPNPDKE